MTTYVLKLVDSFDVPLTVTMVSVEGSEQPVFLLLIEQLNRNLSLMRRRLELIPVERDSSEIIGSRNGEVIRVVADSVPDLRCREAIDCGKEGCTCDGCTMTRKAMAEQPIRMSKVCDPNSFDLEADTPHLV